MNVKLEQIRMDGGTQPRAAINPAIVAEYAEDMRQGAEFPRVVLFFDGTEYWLADGFHRVEAARQAGREEIDAEIRQGDRRKAVLFSVGANANHGFRRTNEDKRRAVMTLLEDEEWKKWSNRKIAEVCAVSEFAVRQYRKPDTAILSQYQERAFIHPKTGQPAVMQTANIGQRGPLHAPEFFSNSATWQRPDAYASEDEIAMESTFQHQWHSSSPATDRAPHVANNSGNNEWYTPPEYLDAARAMLEEIDLDPASCELANQNVRAAQFYSQEDDGLSLDWAGRVWMNPPYSSDLVGRFIDKLLDQYRQGNVTEAIVLVNNATETGWFQALAAQSAAICFPKGRIKYLDATGTPANTPLQGQAFVYLGSRVKRFKDAFSAFGFVVRI